MWECDFEALKTLDGRLWTFVEWVHQYFPVDVDLQSEEILMACELFWLIVEQLNMAKTLKTTAVKRLVKTVKHSFLVKPEIGMAGQREQRRQGGDFYETD